MEPERFVLDSVLIIDHLNNYAPATQFLLATAGRTHITAITFAEVLAGYDPGPVRDNAEAFLDRFPLISIDRPLANHAASLRRTYRWKLPDALQAAAAFSLGVSFATRNTKDFPASAYPWVHIPYVLSSQGKG